MVIVVGLVVLPESLKHPVGSNLFPVKPSQDELWITLQKKFPPCQKAEVMDLLDTKSFGTHFNRQTKFFPTKQPMKVPLRIVRVCIGDLGQYILRRLAQVDALVMERAEGHVLELGRLNLGKRFVGWSKTLYSNQL